ncbi:MAG: hypothetical protein ABUL46_06430, partial [Chitinophaga rupis]
MYLLFAFAAFAFVSRHPTSGTPPDAGLPADTLTAQVASWHHLKSRKEKEGVSREVLKGATRD